MFPRTAMCLAVTGNRRFCVYNKDEIITRKVLDKGLGLAEIEEEIVELLETISINSIKESYPAEVQ